MPRSVSPSVMCERLRFGTSSFSSSSFAPCFAAADSATSVIVLLFALSYVGCLLIS